MEEARQMKREDDEREEEKKMMSRKEKRKAMKKMKRTQIRREIADKQRVEEEARFNDPEEQRRIQLMEQLEAERIERERKLFEERERIFHEQQQQQQKLLQQQHQEFLRQQQQQQQQPQPQTEHEPQATEIEDDDGEWEFVEEEGPPEIIWQGNEIILKKKKVRVRVSHKDVTHTPTSNPLPPESPPEHRLHNVNANVSLQLPYFGTEQDKAHCPFHLKTGACRFGQRCSRVHFYPDNSCTLLIKSMYNGPGLAWEQDEGLEYTDEEVERCFEEFYEDVHTEFLKFGEIVNFKVCKNGSFHLRGNVYVQYKMLDSALLAYNSVNGRYFAGKQVTCEFVNLTRWKVAICGEYMKSGFQTCSHGTACNFIHCFRNPGRDYEWADFDKPPPKYWVKKMAALFGYSDDYKTYREAESLSPAKNSSKMSKIDSDRYHSGRSRSLEMNQLNSGRTGRRKHEAQRKGVNEEWNANIKDDYKMKRRTPDSGRGLLENEQDMETHHKCTRKHSLNRNKVDSRRSLEVDFDVDRATITRDYEKEHGREARNSREGNGDKRDQIYEAGSDEYRYRKRHHIIKRKSSRHQSKNNTNVIGEAESDKDLFDRGDIETLGHSSKSSRQRSSGLRYDYRDHENEDEEGLSWRKSDRRAHHHKK